MARIRCSGTNPCIWVMDVFVVAAHLESNTSAGLTVSSTMCFSMSPAPASCAQGGTCEGNDEDVPDARKAMPSIPFPGGVTWHHLPFFDKKQ